MIKNSLGYFGILLLLVNSSAHAQWNPVGVPHNAAITGIVCTDSIIFIGTQSGVYKSTNNGALWYNFNENEFPLPEWPVTTFSYDGSTIFAGNSGGGLFYSTDGGFEWWWLGGGSIIENQNAIVVKDTLLFVATDFGIAVTSAGVLSDPNSVVTWTKKVNGLDNTGIKTLTVIGSALYAGTMNGVFRTTDNGENWTAINSGMNGYNLSSRVRAIISHDNKIFAGTDGGIFVTTDNGVTWNPVNSGLYDLRCCAFASSGSKLYAGMANGIYVSTNDGANWSPLSNGIGNPVVNALSFHGAILYAGTDAGIYVSDDAGDTWMEINNGLPSTAISTLVANNIALLAGSETNGVFRAISSNATWMASSSGMNNKTMKYFLSTGSELIAATYGGSGVYVSTNSGQTWSAINGGIPNAYGIFVTALANNSSDLYIGIEGYYSGNNGYLGGVFRSTNKGANWSRVTPDSLHFIKSIAVNDSSLFVADYYRGMCRATKDGQQWTKLDNIALSPNSMTLAIQGDELFAGSNDVSDIAKRVFRSTDYGQTWTNVGQGLNTAIINAFRFGPDGSGDLFAATSGGAGVYRLKKNSDTWMPISSGLPGAISVTDLAFFDGYLFAAGVGVWRVSLSEIASVEYRPGSQPMEFGVEQNYPNPFNPSTVIDFIIPQQSFTSIAVTDILGREVARLVNDNLTAGKYSIFWNAQGIPSGTYFYTLRSGGQVQTKKLVLMK
ncbi:MAG: T9SS type A sorting domain-containing protein [Bacteroidota bacterium]